MFRKGLRKIKQTCGFWIFVLKLNKIQTKHFFLLKKEWAKVIWVHFYHQKTKLHEKKKTAKKIFFFFFFIEWILSFDKRTKCYANFKKGKVNKISSDSVMIIEMEKQHPQKSQHRCKK